MVERDLALAAYEGQPLHLLHLSARESVEALAGRAQAGVAATAEVTPHHLCLTDEAVRSLDPNVKMNPPLRAADDRAGADRRRSATGRSRAIATDHAPHARHEKDVPFEAAPFGVTGLETAFAALYTRLVEPGLLAARRRCSSGCRPGPPGPTGSSAPRIAVGAPANLVLLDLEASLAGRGGRLPLAVGQLVAARRDAAGPDPADGRRRQGWCSRHDRVPRARGRHRLPRRVGRRRRASPSARRSSRPR